MALTYEPIASVTTSGSGIVSFTSIPTTYTDLRVIAWYPYGTSPGGDWEVTLNNNQTSIEYTSRVVYSSTANDGSFEANRYLYFSNAGGMYTTTVMMWADIMSYRDTTKQKVVFYGSAQSNISGQSESTQWNCGQFNNTAAVTSVQITNQNNLPANAKVTLFGIKAA